MNYSDKVKCLYDNYCEISSNPVELHDFIYHLGLREPYLDEFGKVNVSFVIINGKAYVCECGTNLFFNPDKLNMELWQCNCCDVEFITS